MTRMATTRGVSWLEGVDGNDGVDGGMVIPVF
jgi:hypothetical protein